MKEYSKIEIDTIDTAKNLVRLKQRLSYRQGGKKVKT